MTRIEQLDHDVTLWLKDATAAQMLTVLDAIAGELTRRALPGAMYAHHGAGSLRAYVLAYRERDADPPPRTS